MNTLRQSIQVNYTDARSYTYALFAPQLGGRVGAAFDWTIMGLIVINISAIMLETVDPIQATYQTHISVIRRVSVFVFTIEYAARVWSIVEAQEYQKPILGRARFITSPLMIVDLIVLVPFYLTGLFPDVVNPLILRTLRLLRVLRLLKIARYTESIRSIGAVFRREKERLVISALINSILLVLSSSIMYQLEHKAQPELFSSIPQTLWWGAVTLTTVGYGDMYPVTDLGRLFGAIIAVFGIGLFALPASILAAGFIKDGENEDTGTDNSESDSQEDPSASGGIGYCPHCGTRLPHNTPDE